MSKKDIDVIKHLTFSDRVVIEQGLYQGKTFQAIALEINKDPSTVAKEVKRFLNWEGGAFARIKGNNCVHAETCTVDILCFRECQGYCKDHTDCDWITTVQRC